MSRERFGPAYAALAVLYLAPLAVTPYLPAFDLPHHLALVDALTKVNDPDSPYARDFSIGLTLAPFVLHYVVLRALAVVMPVTLAAKVLVAAVVLTLPLATARLLSVSGRDRIVALPAFALAYSMPLHYGLIGFVVAMPFLVWMVAEAANEEGWRARPLRSALVLGSVALLTFFAHLEAWAIGAVAAVAALLLASIPWRTRAIGIVSLAPSALGCVLFLVRTARDPHFSGEPSSARALLIERLRELNEYGALSELVSRLQGIPVHLLRGFNDGSDVVAAHIFVGLMAAVIVARLVTWIRRRPRTLSRPRPATAAIAVALGAYLGLPFHLPHASSIYPRFAVVLALFLLLVVPPLVATWPGRAKRAGAALVVLTLSAYALVLIRQYAQFGRELADFRLVVDESPAGLRSGGLVFDAESGVMNIGGIFTGIPAYYVFERPAPGSSTWLYYCSDPQVPCRLRDPAGAPPLPFFSYPAEFDARRALERIDLLFVRGGPSPARIFGAETGRVRLLAERGRWRVFARR